jgi:hypothetical protein
MKITQEHAEAMRKAFWHTVTWAEDIIHNFYMKGLKYEPLKLIIKAFLWFAKKKMRDLELNLLPQFSGKELALKMSESELKYVCQT